jgi:type VI secretion system protein ImpK
MGKLSLPSRSTMSTLPLTIQAKSHDSRESNDSQTSRMSQSDVATDSLLLRQFRLFVAEVMRLLGSFEHTHLQSEDSPESARRAAADVCESLAREIDAQTLDISRSGSTADRAAVDELRYLKAAIADELLLSRDWPGRSRYTEHLVETRLFGTSIAGDEIFYRIEALLDHAVGQPSQMAPLYLFAISIGFEGRYRGPQAAEALQPLRDALFRLIYRREPEFAPGLTGQPHEAHRVLSDQAYQYPLSNIAPVRFFRFSRGMLAFIGTMVLLVALSQLAWRWTSAPVRKALEPSAPTQLKHSVPSEAERG